MKKSTLIAITMIFGVLSGLYAQIIHVPANQPTIQAGINATTNGDTVLVAEGTYTENINYMGKAITVASNFIMDGDTNHINNTIIDGSNPANQDTASVVSFLTGEDTTSILCGFTITGGSGMYLSTYDARIGGGIVCHYATAKIIHNKILENELNGSENAWGAGIASINYTGEYWTVVEYNKIRQNGSFATGQGASGGGLEVWGNAKIKNNIIENNHCYNEGGGAGAGGGVVVTSPGSTSCLLYFHANLVQNNMVENNFSSLTWGGGMYVSYSNCMITNNVFSNNTISGDDGAAGGGLYTSLTASLNISDNQFSFNNIILSTNNNWWGAGLFCGTPLGKTSIMNNEFSYNTGSSNNNGRGGGICLKFAQDNEVTIDANLIMNNCCFRGGGLYSQDSYNLFLTNNIFSENSATGDNFGRGGGIAMFHPVSKSSSPTANRYEFRPLIVNNTFYSNSADERGGGFRFNGELSPPEIDNCIFWENDAPDGKDIDWASGSTLMVSFSDLDTGSINGSWTGEGNIFEDPLFEGSGEDPYALDEGSPCIDTGTPDTTGLNLPLWDILYNYRFWDGDGDGDTIIDMGAYEYDAIGVGLNPERITNYGLRITNNPNPFSGFTTIEFFLSKPGITEFTILNQHGQVMEKISVHGQKGRNQVTWYASSLPAGIYFCRVTSSNASAIRKLVLVK